jgi:hypothetical protein
MNIDFFESFKSFEAYTRFCHDKRWYPDKHDDDRPHILRAGRFGYRVKDVDKDYDEICKWCEGEAAKVEESIPEDLVVAA